MNHALPNITPCSCGKVPVRVKKTGERVLSFLGLVLQARASYNFLHNLKYKKLSGMVGVLCQSKFGLDVQDPEKMSLGIKGHPNQRHVAPMRRSNARLIQIRGSWVGYVSAPPFGRRRLGAAVWVPPFGCRCLGAAVWAPPFECRCLGAAVWAPPFECWAFGRLDYRAPGFFFSFVFL